MEANYGIHLGMVINKADPEGRKRVQVFIPHISATLFANWNNQMTDKQFRNPNELADYGVLDKLKNTLPWAEAGMPLFGGSTAMTANDSNHTIVVNNSGTSTLTPDNKKTDTPDWSRNHQTPLPSSNDGTLPASTGGSTPTPISNTNGAYPNSLSEVPENVLKYVYSIGASESGLPASTNVTQGDLNAISKESYGANLLNDVGNNATVRNAYNTVGSPTYHDLAASQAVGGDYGPYQYNAGNSADAYSISKGAIILNNRGSIESQTLGLAQYMYYKDNGLYNSLTDNQWNGSYSGRFGGLFVQGPGALSKRNAAYDNLSRDEILANLGAIDSNTTLASSAADSNTGINVVAEAEADIFNNNMPKDDSNSNVARTANTASSASGSPNGMFSVPNEGAKVWVFFYGGDIQKPIYFAAAVEPT